MSAQAFFHPRASEPTETNNTAKRLKQKTYSIQPQINPGVRALRVAAARVRTVLGLMPSGCATSLLLPPAMMPYRISVSRSESRPPPITGFLALRLNIVDGLG